MANIASMKQSSFRPRSNYTKPKNKAKMYERILYIEEGSFNVASGVKWNGEPEFGYYDGYIVTTEKQTIKVGISNSGHCCEHFGYLTTNDDLSEFVGAYLTQIATVDTALKVEPLKDAHVTDVNACMFVNFSTSRGTMQLVAYNEHNGYYGHDAVVVSESFNHQENL